MFAIVETGGKQYTVSDGGVLRIEKVAGQKGDKIVFDKVLLLSDGSQTTIGTPYIDGASVEAVCMVEGKQKKVTVIKYKAKSRYFKKRGHRQPFTQVKIAKVK